MPLGLDGWHINSKVVFSGRNMAVSCRIFLEECFIHCVNSSLGLLISKLDLVFAMRHKLSLSLLLVGHPYISSKFIFSKFDLMRSLFSCNILVLLVLVQDCFW